MHEKEQQYAFDDTHDPEGYKTATFRSVRWKIYDFLWGEEEESGDDSAVDATSDR